MDRQRSKKKRFPKIYLWGGISVVLLLVVYLAFIRDNSSKYVIEKKSLTFSKVTKGVFSDFIALDGTIEPEQTFILDAIQGGHVEEILVENGQMVQAGQVLVRLSNPDLELEYMNRENLLYDVINNLQNSKQNIEKNRLQLKQSLLEIEFQAALAEKQYRSDSVLAASGAVPQDQLLSSRLQYKYLSGKHKLMLESLRRDSIASAQQAVQLESSSGRLFKNLALLKSNLEKLEVKSPIAGQLSSLTLSPGQSVTQGKKIGQIDVPGKLKIKAKVTDRYIDRIEVGQDASLLYSGQKLMLKVSKIYPDVVDGQFEIDFAFAEAPPEGFKRGQNVTVNLDFGSEENALMIRRGRFFNETGGRWIFVYNGEKGTAERREIQIGKQNTNSFQVLSGLQEGEVVIISPYSSFLQKDKLIITD